MKNIKRKIATVLMALGVTFGMVAVAPVANAAPAHALTTWNKEVVYCDWVYVYRHYDYNWVEEVFQGKRDYDLYLYKYYSYNWYCHNVVPR